jgi:hypothetical protein
MAGAGLLWEKSTAGWLLVAGLFWDKSTAGWWPSEQGAGLHMITHPERSGLEDMVIHPVGLHMKASKRACPVGASGICTPLATCLGCKNYIPCSWVLHLWLHNSSMSSQLCKRLVKLCLFGAYIFQEETCLPNTQIDYRKEGTKVQQKTKLLQYLGTEHSLFVQK